ncbi:Crp/Fnr family transcriptional regulator [Shimia sp. SDUM112013]|uniref:Crp/Fnr family transcriptional regulator n=1 Tax=Shimia sp. SDUM112013 TaxID=3136160 RepID=UPI0032EC5F24
MNELDFSLLTDLPLFAQLSEEDCRAVLSKARTRYVERGDDVFSEGAEATHFFLLLDGHVRVERVTPEGDRVIPLLIPPGQLIGIAAALGKDTYPATAVAASDCFVLQWPMRRWSEFSTTYPGFATETFKTVGCRLDEINRRVMELATQRVEQRVANALLGMARNNARPDKDGLVIGFPLTRKQISEMTGSTLHTVSRLLSHWQNDGLLTSTKKEISILDVRGLENLASRSA